MNKLFPICTLIVAHFSDDYYVIMDSKFKDGPFEYINLDGKNVGATMRLHHRSTKGELKDCCCINIYVNNNVQGVTNSVMHDSEVRMRDPGVSLYFEDLKIDKVTPSYYKRLCLGDKLGSCICILILLAILFLLVLLLSTRIIIFILWNHCLVGFLLFILFFVWEG